MTLTLLSYLLGIVIVITSVLALMKPAAAKAFLKAYPRSLPCGYAMLAVSTVWFLYYFSREDIADFAAIKTQMFVFFIILAAGVGIYVKDFLAVRAHAVFMFLVAKLIYDTARYADSGWAILFPALATVLVFFGMWFTVSPWRLRDMLQGLINRDKLWKSFWFGRMLLGILLVFLGVAGIR